MNNPWLYDALAEAIRIELYGEEYCNAKTDKGRERAYKKRCRSVCPQQPNCPAGKCSRWDSRNIPAEKP